MTEHAGYDIIGTAWHEHHGFPLDFQGPFHCPIHHWYADPVFPAKAPKPTKKEHMKIQSFWGIGVIFITYIIVK